MGHIRGVSKIKPNIRLKDKWSSLNILNTSKGRIGNQAAIFRIYHCQIVVTNLSKLSQRLLN